MGRMHRFIGAGLVCVALSACAKSTSGGGSSETHFLALCNASCGEGLSCVCGICTEACDDDGACEELSGQASCQIAVGDSCTTARVCDVECDSDDDCGKLGNEHECDDGRCRAPLIAGAAGEGGTSGGGGADGGGMSGGGSGGTGAVSGMGGNPPIDVPEECTTTAVAEFLAGSEVDSCYPATDIEPGPTWVPDCINDHMAASEPFRLVWPLQGIDSSIARGVVGFMDEAGEYRLYELYYDSLGFGDGTHTVWTTQWTPIDSLTVADQCAEPSGCVAYDIVEHAACGCGTDPEDGELFVECQTPPVQECEAPSCFIDGICYPNGESSEDGCCSCEDGSYTCIEPGWCPSWPLIGKRCDSDADCMQVASSGLRCQASISGEHNICTRDCNFGCPTGTECVETDDFSGELCMRSCTTDANCNIDVFSESLGSECAAVGEGGMYCR